MAHRFLFLPLMLAALPAAGGVFTLSPSSGTVSGLPGAKTGWGYTIANNTGNYLVVANSYFCEAGQDPLFTTCTQTLGTYTDYVANAATVVGPNATVNGSFNVTGQQGTGQYAINSTASSGQTDSGNIVLVYDVFTANPFVLNSNAQQIGGDVEVFVPAAVQVTTTQVPAVGSTVAAALALLLLALGGYILWRADAARPEGRL